MYYKKKIAIFSGNRAEYGLLNPIIRSISKNKKFDVDNANVEIKILKKLGSHLEEDDEGHDCLV